MSILEKCNFFTGVSQNTLAAIEHAVERSSYSSGAVIFQAGEPADYFYVLEDGRVRLRFSEGGQVAYALSDPGEVFGWSSMIDQAQYTLSAQSVSKVSAVRIHKAALAELLNDDPPSGLAFYRNMSVFVGQRLFASYKATVFVHGERSSLSYG